MDRKTAVYLIGLYRKYISGALPTACRFHPSCSRYAEGAIVKHGLGKGIYLAVRRILRCHPFSKGGYDPVK